MNFIPKTIRLTKNVATAALWLTDQPFIFIMDLSHIAVLVQKFSIISMIYWKSMWAVNLMWKCLFSSCLNWLYQLMQDTRFDHKYTNSTNLQSCAKTHFCSRLFQHFIIWDGFRVFTIIILADGYYLSQNVLHEKRIKASTSTAISTSCFLPWLRQTYNNNESNNNNNNDSNNNNNKL